VLFNDSVAANVALGDAADPARGAQRAGPARTCSSSC